MNKIAYKNHSLAVAKGSLTRKERNQPGFMKRSSPDLSPGELREIVYAMLG
jgi:hypothetical protein